MKVLPPSTPRHACEAVMAMFIWGPVFCGLNTRRKVRCPDGTKRWVCKFHRKELKNQRWSDKEGKIR